MIFLKKKVEEKKVTYIIAVHFFTFYLRRVIAQFFLFFIFARVLL